jgi:ketosteroid isomerase-like protein
MLASAPINKQPAMTTRTILLFIFVLNGAAPIFSQQDSVLQTEIDTQVWRPFIQAYTNLNAEAYNNLHTADVLRGSPWGLSQGEAYFQRNREHFAKLKSDSLERKIAFTFEYRVQQADIAYEVGYYRLINQRAGDEQRFYGQFHVVLKKENGRWKIAQDWDASSINGLKITEADFLKQAQNGIFE